MVVTAKVTDATPACFASHVSDRQYENAIAEQLVGNSPLNRTVDVLFGGGLCHFMPKGEGGSCRTDDLDLLSMAKDRGFTFLPNRDALSSPPAKSPLPALGLFAPGVPPSLWPI
jgi:alkaline phosphatase